MTVKSTRTPVGEMRAAAAKLRKHPDLMGQRVTDVATAWLESAANDVEAVERAADMYQLDPLELVDEPDSAARALAFARAVNGGEPGA